MRKKKFEVDASAPYYQPYPLHKPPSIHLIFLFVCSCRASLSLFKQRISVQHFTLRRSLANLNQILQTDDDLVCFRSMRLDLFKPAEPDSFQREMAKCVGLFSVTTKLPKPQIELKKQKKKPNPPIAPLSGRRSRGKTGNRQR